MILAEIRRRDGARETIAVHPGVTVIRGLAAERRRTWAADLARALKGEPTDAIDLEVEVDGVRRPLSVDLVRSLGLAGAATGVTVYAVDLPGAKAAPEPVDDPAGDPAALEADLATAEADVRRLEDELVAAERAASAAAEELDAAGGSTDDEAATALAAAEARVEAARSSALAARDQLVAAEDLARSADESDREERSAVAARLAELDRQRAEADGQRQAILGRLAAIGRAGDPKPVEQALAGLHRLQSVKPKPSIKAVALADRWAEAQAALAALPQPPQPPEWLVTPALAALQEAREALAEAETGSGPPAVDPEKVEALDRAHRELLEAEQRAMKKGSRTNRRRLDIAQEAEQAALGDLGVNSYGDYLQRVAPMLEGGTSTEERITAAKAALADAEAVWEELHGGQASPEWTAAKERQAALRAEAMAMLGEHVDDDELESRLRSHLETVVDTEWAERALVKALREAGGALASEASPEAAAEAWLRDAPAIREASAALEAELSEVEGRLTAIEEQLAERRAAAGDDLTGEGAGDAASTAPDDDGSGPLAAFRRAAAEADEAERVAEEALAEARERLRSTEAAAAGRADLEAAADARRNEVDRLRIAVTEAEGVRDEVRERADRPAPDPAAAPGGAVDLSAVVGMEAEAYLLARVSALRGVPGGPLPLVMDGDAVAALPEAAGRRVRRLLGRLAGQMQVVVLADDDAIATWAEGLGDRAAVRQVAR